MLDDNTGFPFGNSVYLNMVKALCRSLNFLNTKLAKPCALCFGACFAYRAMAMLAQKRAFHKLLPEGWKHPIV